MHDVPGQTHWHEPTGGQRAGFGKCGRPKTPYDLFMESEGIPVFRDIGMSKVQNLPLAPWKRLGRARHLYPAPRHRRQMGLLPGRGARRAARSTRKSICIEKIFYVVEGRGSTEVWLDRRLASATCSSGSRARCSRSR